MTFDELQALREPEILSLIAGHAHDDPAEFSMRFHGRTDFPVRAVAEQLACRRKAALKLPSLSGKPLLYTKLALEQASGERAAEWKSGLMSGRRIIDMTGGLGIDAVFFSRRFEAVVCCERDPVLASIADHNRRVLGIGNVDTKVGDSALILEGFDDDSFDWLYVDPARRESGGRSVGLEATSPDVVRLHDLMLRKAPKACIKASPALELSGLEEKLPALAAIVAVSVGGECKELLLLLDRAHRPGVRPAVSAACLLADGVFEIASVPDDPATREVADAPGAWFYEPDAAIIKARLSAELARRLGFCFISPKVDYLTADRLVRSFPGRAFRLEERLPFKPKSFRKQLEERGIEAAAIQRRDFPLSVEDLRSKFRLKESSSRFLFFTKDGSGELACFICSRAPDVSEALRCGAG